MNNTIPTYKSKTKNGLVYIGGSLFTEADRRQRMIEGQALKDLDITNYNPIENKSINDKMKNPTAESIFDGDTGRVLDSQVLLADIQNEGPGLMVEIGLAIGINIAKKLAKEGKLDYVPYKEIVAHNSDIRIPTAGNYDGHHVPYGQNQYVIGAIEKYGTIHNSYKDAIDKVVDIIDKNNKTN